MEILWGKVTTFVATQSTLAAAIVAGIFAVLSTLTTSWTKARQSSTPLSKRISHIQHATGRVRFWSSWYRSISQRGTGNERLKWAVLVKEQLELAAREMAHAMDQHDENLKEHLASDERTKTKKKEVDRLPWFRQYFLLYRPPNGYAIFRRGAHYILICFIALALYGNLMEYRENRAAQKRFELLALDHQFTDEDRRDLASRGEAFRARNDELRRTLPLGYLLFAGVSLFLCASAMDAETKRKEFQG